MTSIVRFSFYGLSCAPLVAVFFTGLFDFYWATGGYFIIISILNLLSRHKEGKKIVVPAYIKLLSCTFVYYLIWALSQDFYIQGSFYKFLYKNPVFISIFVFLLIENYDFERSFVLTIYKIFVGTVIISCLVSLIQAFYNPDFFMPLNNQNFYGEFETEFGKVRFVSIFGWVSQNDYGLSYLPIVSLVFASSLLHQNKINPLLLMLTVIYVILSGGRWIMMGYLIVFTQYFIFKKIKPITIIKYVTLFAVFLFAAVKILSVTGYDLSRLTERLESKSYESRYLAYDLFLKYFPDNPFFGTGVHITRQIANDIAGQSSQIHVGYLSHLLSYGVVGSFFLFGAWAALLIKLLRVAKVTRFYGAAAGFLTFLAANIALVDYSIYYYGIVFLVVFSNYYERSYIKNQNERKILKHRMREQIPS